MPGNVISFDWYSKMTKYLKVLFTFFLAAIIWSAISPLSKGNWLLEMIPVFFFIPLTIYLGMRYLLSDLSYTLICLYMIMLVLQAHYGVGYVPMGMKLAPWFGTERNVFDRITHFFSGLLLFYPLYEMTKQSIGKRDLLDYLLPAAVIMGVGAVYEIAEWLAFEFSGPRLSFLFIGAQDDFYDTPKDMAMSLAGIIIAVVVIAAENKFSRGKLKKRR
jgi:putative membrane protein